MLMPVLVGTGAATVASGAGGQGVHALESGGGVVTGSMAVAAHTLAMLVVMGVVAVVVYEKVGLGILRTG